MKNLEFRMRALVAFFILNSSLFILVSCSPRSVPAPPPPPPAPAPVAVAAPEPQPATIDEARSLLANHKPEAYERGLKALAMSSDAKVARRALAMLGLYQLDQKRWDEAVATLAQAADAYAEVAPFLRLRIVDAEVQRGDVQSAIKVAQQIIATAGDTSAATIARLRLPALYAQAGDAASTDAAYRQISTVAIDELSEGELVKLATALAKAGRNDLATVIRMRLVNEYPGGRYTEQLFDQLPLDTLSFDETTALASKLARADHYDEALKLLDRASKRFPEATKSAMYRTVRVKALFNSRHYSELMSETAGQKLEPSLALLRARAAWRAGAPQEFLAGLAQIETSAPDSREAAEAKLLRAKYYTTDEVDYGKAVDNLQDAIDAGLAGGEGENLWTLGWTYVLWGHDDDALRVFDRYLREYPDGDYRTNALFWSGKIYAKRGDNAARDAKWSQLVAEYPYSYYAYRVRQAPTPVGGGQAGAPVLHAFPDLTIAEPRVDVVNELASIDLLRDATREMKLIAAAHPDSPGIAFALADLYVRAGEPFKANGILQRKFREFVRHGGANVPQRFWEILFPLSYWETIQAKAAKRNVDPYLLASIIRQESGFEPSTVSNAGAVGLMQIMPAEASRIAGQEITRQALFDPQTNIMVGAAEYAQKLAAMHGNQVLAIAAYNAGEEAVSRWLEKTPIADEDVFIESIPYAETRLYVKTVTRNRFEYQRVYGR
jgi:soluble lytic murein transglycosylase